MPAATWKGYVDLPASLRRPLSLRWPWPFSAAGDDGSYPLASDAAPGMEQMRIGADESPRDRLRRYAGTWWFRAVAVVLALFLLDVGINKLFFGAARPEAVVGQAWQDVEDSDSSADSGPLHPDILENETKPAAGTSAEQSTGANLSRAIIASSLKETKNYTDWIAEMFPEWDVSVYIVDDPTGTLTVAKNQGREASVYLTYILDHYHDLPDYMVFIHGGRYQWHNDEPMYDTAPTIRDLSLKYIDEVGYASLRCTWWPGCPAWLYPKAGVRDPECWKPGCPLPGQQKGKEAIKHFPLIQGSFAATFQKIFPGQPVPIKVGSPCCAQFAVSKAAVLARPIEDYQRIKRWLFSSRLDSFKLGAIMEHMWHIIFGQPADMCSIPAQKCNCDKFQLCDLECPFQESCGGRFWRKPWGDFGMSSGWPEHGQGQDNMPYEGWWDVDPFQRHSAWYEKEGQYLPNTP